MIYVSEDYLGVQSFNNRKHQCSSCGGNLIVDNDKQIYRCVSCGSTYDYEYFREELMHEMGETYLSNGEYMAAADAYKFKLKKVPDDFLARRGLMLAAARLKDMNDLIIEDYNKGARINLMLVCDVVEGAPEKDKGYFEDLVKIYSDMKNLSKLSAEIKSLDKDSKRIGDELRFTKESCQNFKIETGYLAGKAPMEAFVSAWVLDFFLFAAMLSLVVPLAVNGPMITTLFVGLSFALVIGLIAIVNMTAVYPEVKELKELKAYIKELEIESGAIYEKIGKLKKEADKLSEDLSLSTKNFVEKDRLKMKDYIKG